MQSSFENLSSSERRLVVGVGLVIFLILNMVFIWPRFKDWGDIEGRMTQARDKISSYNRLISRSTEFKGKLIELEGIGSNVPSASQANELIRMIQEQARKSQLPTPNISPVKLSNDRSTNNVFFDQKAYRLTVTTEDANLVDFLVAIGSGESMIRVHDLDLKPKPPQNSELICNMTLVANYQKQPTEE
ncbi:MAG: hypothetical protein ACPGL0_10775 [Limisphaerales bacterium]|jgi:Tfp pilus assembly protein PilO|nr:hypothetical protein [Verrucomicrobiota bacterium]